jgi:hypothetical protein
MKANESKIAFIYFHFLGFIGAYFSRWRGTDWRAGP